MSSQEPFQLQRLVTYPDVKQAMERLSRGVYEADVQWIGDHFRFASNQLLDPTSDPMAVEGHVDDLGSNGLVAILERFGVPPTRPVHVIWAYGDFGIVLPLRLANKYLLREVWYPATDDVFVLDPADEWCVELHHEGHFVCMCMNQG